MPDLDANKNLVRKYVDEMWNKANFAEVDNILAPNFEVKNSGYDHPDRQGDMEFINQHRQAFPDMHYVITDMVAEGDNVTAQITGTGTHRGPWMGKRPTGKKVTVRGSAIYTIREGKIVGAVHNVDILGVLMDIGGVSPNILGKFKRPM